MSSILTASKRSRPARTARLILVKNAGNISFPPIHLVNIKIRKIASQVLSLSTKVANNLLTNFKKLFSSLLETNNFFKRRSHKKTIPIINHLKPIGKKCTVFPAEIHSMQHKTFSTGQKNQAILPKLKLKTRPTFPLKSKNFYGTTFCLEKEFYKPIQ